MARNRYDEDEVLEEEFRPEDYKRVGRYLIPYKITIIKVLISILISNVALMLGPYFTKIVIDTVIPQADIGALVRYSIYFTLAIIVACLGLYYRLYAITEIGQDVLVDMRFDIFSHVQSLPFSYFDNRPHGKILTRIVNYINTLSDLLSNGVVNLISDIFNIIITLIFMLALDVRLTLYSLMLLPVLFIIVMVIKNIQRKAYQNLSNKQSNLNAYIHESIAGIRITQSFAREQERYEIFEEQSKENYTAFMDAVRIQFAMWPSVQNIAVISTAIIYFVGIRQIGVDVSTGTLIAFISYINNFWNPIINIGNFYNNLITATAYLERIFETLDIVPEIQDNPGATELPPIEGNVTFDHVTFRYEAGKDILHDVSFDIEAGQTIALVGPTGAGKTTIINLLSRFYDINEGTISIDGYDISQVTLSSLREKMGVMLQDTFIFSGTILENIRYGRLDATKEEIIEAAKTVHAHEFIMELKNGYDTVVEERGSTLSSGQRQLLAFARTLLADPAILILDEATSSIDTKTEELLQEGLQRLLKGRTSFIIAHRLSTIKNSDQIFYIANQTIQEKGSHEELMQQRGLYYRLYQSQYDLLFVE
ncbi:ABC transporter ATP-binding protein [Fundicoccus culcitae]|uniref:ABC transporter ATP-binding protein/permease n=1 Tax=Fundicoccus culcitae TaxID=2969821 RepID=A0ABY5P2P8_9LACT|nr:ABC transporter ATP-binding protein [Fundicoccus culcitae]UUX33002.1 ABC transporter ATP-binding protein/permease [Fundicoccus culcitae]